MIYFATLIRVSDGLALSASTDLDTTFEVKESKKRLKLLSRKVGQLPARCTTKIGTYCIHFIRTGSLCTMMICSSQYPQILAFSFLNELQKEFLQQYKNEDIQRAKRPYTFVEFDMFIQRMKQRYSSTNSLTNRINISDINEDLKQSPPYEIKSSELMQSNGMPETKYQSSGKVLIVAPLTWLGYLTGALCLVCAFLNILRFFPLFAYYGVENEGLRQEFDLFSVQLWYLYIVVPTQGLLFLVDIKDNNVIAALAFLVGALLNVLLFYLLLLPLKLKIFVSYTMGGLLLAVIYYLWKYRNIVQVIFHVSVTLLAVYQIRQRQITIKPPDYNI